MMAFRGTRMAKEWNVLPVGSNDFTADGTALLGSLAFMIPGTILRMLGEYVIAPTTNPVALDQVTLTVGVGFVSTDAAAAGAASMPDPAVEGEFPWLYWASHAFVYEDVNGVYSPAEAVRKSFDVKTMRRFKPRQSLVCVVQYQEVTVAPPMSIVAAPTRVLFGT